MKRWMFCRLIWVQFSSLSNCVRGLVDGYYLADDVLRRLIEIGRSWFYGSKHSFSVDAFGNVDCYMVADRWRSSIVIAAIITMVMVMNTVVASFTIIIIVSILMIMKGERFLRFIPIRI